MTDIHHEVTTAAPRARILAALENPKDLAAWNGGTVSRDGDMLRFDYADAPRFRWRIAQTGPDGVTWACVEGPGQSAGTTAHFTLAPASKERTRIELVHAGWPDTGGNWRKCNTHWGALLHALRRYLETGAHAPVFG